MEIGKEEQRFFHLCLKAYCSRGKLKMLKGCISEEENSSTVFYLFKRFKKQNSRLSSRTLQN